MQLNRTNFLPLLSFSSISDSHAPSVRPVQLEWTNERTYGLINRQLSEEGLKLEFAGSCSISSSTKTVHSAAIIFHYIQICHEMEHISIMWMLLCPHEGCKWTTCQHSTGCSFDLMCFSCFSNAPLGSRSVLVQIEQILGCEEEVPFPHFSWSFFTSLRLILLND